MKEINESPETSDASPEKQKVLKELLEAQEELEGWLGVRDLTTIEGFRLRKIVEQCLVENEAQKEKVADKSSRGDRQGAWLADLAVYEDISKEVAERWLLELYGILSKDIPGVYRVQDKTDGKDYIYYSSEEAYRKEVELEAQGHEAYAPIFGKVDEKFKEYLKMLREKAHHP